MRWFANPGRFIGLLYVLISIPGAFALIYVPSRLIVDGNASATAANLAASETMFRLGIAAEITSQILFLWLALRLYDLLKAVNVRRAAIMLVLIGVSLPIALVDELNAYAALLLVRGDAYLGAIDEAQREAYALLFLNLHFAGFGIAQIFWGLWLFPLGLLVYRSGFIPRLIGALLVVSGFAYTINSFVSLVLPGYEQAVARWVSPFRHGELVFMVWLLAMGAIPKSLSKSRGTEAHLIAEPSRHD